MPKEEKELEGQKEKVEKLGKELKGLSDEELDQISGGQSRGGNALCSSNQKYSLLENRCVPVQK